MIIDRHTSLPVSKCTIIIDRDGELTESQSDLDGYLNVAPGEVILRPADGQSFEEARAKIEVGSTEILVAARFKISIRGVVGTVVRLRATLEVVQETEAGDFAQGTGGIMLGPVLQEWRQQGVYWPLTAGKPLVLEIEGGSVKPAHPLWSGVAIEGEGGVRHVRVPDLVTKPTISAIMNGCPGASYEFDVTRDAPVSQLEYFLDGPVTALGSVQLLAIAQFAGNSNLVKQVGQQDVGPAESTAIFSDVVPGRYVVRSALCRGQDLFLSWQLVDIGDRSRKICREGAGRGNGILWIDDCPSKATAVALSCGETDGMAVSYCGFEIGEIKALHGLHGTNGSLRVYCPASQSDRRHNFDLVKSARISLAR